MRLGLRILSAAALTSAGSLHAQQPTDSLEFRRGQWAAEFAAGTEARGLGVLRFLSPRRALVLDGSGGYVKSTRDQTSESTNREFQVRLGVRLFRIVAPRVRQYFTVGATGGMRREHQERPATALSPAVDQTTRVHSGGVFANIGGQWQPSMHLALGANWEASYALSKIREENPLTSASTTTHGVSVGTARLVLTVLF